MEQDPRTRIVVVDDDEATRKLVQRQLESAGYTVAAFGDGQSALQAVCGMGSGIVIADWSMPGMSGLELCRALAELQELRALGNMHFIMLTAYHEKERVVEGLNAGAHDYLTKPYHAGELLARVRVGERMLRLQEQLLQRHIEVQKANAQMAVLATRLDMLAHTDALTQLPNRRSLFQTFEQAWESCQRDVRPLTCIVIDIDRFKRVNDTYGHAAGDQVLIHVAQIVARHAPQRELCGRVGGEEFVLILPGLALPVATAVAERIRQEIAAEPAMVKDLRLTVTVSCGVAARAADMHSPDELMSNADAMLYAAKENGRNQTWVSGPNGTWYPATDAAAAAAANLPPAPDAEARARPAAPVPRGDGNTNLPIQSAHADSRDQR